MASRPSRRNLFCGGGVPLQLPALSTSKLGPRPSPSRVKRLSLGVKNWKVMSRGREQPHSGGGMPAWHEAPCQPAHTAQVVKKP